MLEVQSPGRPVSGTVRPPGSKSLTNRALVTAALARPGASRLYGVLEADDSRAMVEGLRHLGVLIDDNEDPWLVLGTGGDLQPAAATIDVGASGTTARFITAVAALASGPTTIDGTPRMRERPIGPLTGALRALGADVEATDGFPPVRIGEGTGLRGGKVRIDSTRSSQFASALLLVAPLAAEPVEIELDGPVVSRSYLQGTVEVMEAFGGEVTVEGDTYRVEPTGYSKSQYTIEADASAAVYPAVAAAITGGSVLIQGIPPGSSQPDLAVLEILVRMGCSVGHDSDGLTVTGSGKLAAFEADFTEAPDGALAMAVAALFADGPSRLSGLSTLGIKETDRLAALQIELSRLGAGARVEGDTLVVEPAPLHPATVETYGDHRMAMSFALVGLVVSGVRISDATVVTKTWPGYFAMLESL